MKLPSYLSHVLIPILLLAGGFLVSCGDGESEAPPTLASVATVPITPDTTNTEQVLPPPATAVPPTPTVTTEPLAAVVNGDPITLVAYEKNLARHEQAGQTLAITDTNFAQAALDELIERRLIVQAGLQVGIVATPELVEQRLNEMQSAAQSQEDFLAWLQANQWENEEAFKKDLSEIIVVDQMVAYVTADVPVAMDQVQARFIELDNSALAQTVLEQIQGGDDFALRAEQYSLNRFTAENGGDLGFFPEGTLLIPEIEQLAFSLGIGETDLVTVTNDDGSTRYYVVQVVAIEAQRPLTANQRRDLMEARFQSWLAELWAMAEINRLVNTNDL